MITEVLTEAVRPFAVGAPISERPTQKGILNQHFCPPRLILKSLVTAPR